MLILLKKILFSTLNEKQIANLLSLHFKHQVEIEELKSKQQAEITKMVMKFSK